jgi:hypothetical protein
MSRSIQYEDFALRIAFDKLQGLVVRVQSLHGASDTPMELPYDEAHLERILGTLESVVQTATRHGRLARQDSRWTCNPGQIGRDLFASVFHGTIGESFFSSIGRVSQGRGLRIRLVFDPEEENLRQLCALPWELLHPPARTNHNFLARDPRTPVIRSIPVPSYRGVQEPLSRLRVLAVMANPVGTLALDLERERERLEEALEEHPRVELRFLERPCIGDLRQALRDEDIHAFHFMGHGEVDPATGEGALLFETPEGKPDPVSGPFLTETLRAANDLRLAFLNACDSARLPGRRDQDAYTGVASALVLGGIPMVLAMQFPVSDNAAITFSKAFYGALGAGDPAEAALAEGRFALAETQRSGWEWATPVLFLGSVDGTLLSPEESAPSRPLPPRGPNIQAGDGGVIIVSENQQISGGIHLNNDFRRG